MSDVRQLRVELSEVLPGTLLLPSHQEKGLDGPSALGNPCLEATVRRWLESGPGFGPEHGPLGTDLGLLNGVLRRGLVRDDAITSWR